MKLTQSLFLILTLVLSSCASSTLIPAHGPRTGKTSSTSQTDGSRPNNTSSEVTTPGTLSPDTAAPQPSAPAAAVVVDHVKQLGAEVKTETKPVSTVTYPTVAKKIGLILPLTGKNAGVSQRLVDAVRMGLNLKNATGEFSNFILTLYDSQGNPAVAAKGVEKLLKDDHVIAIIGGIAGKEASAIAEQADFFQVPFFAFSQKSDLTKNSYYTFRNAITPAMQVNKLVEYAVTTLKARRLAILYPNDPYGIEFANAFWDHALAYGAQITAAQTYDPKTSDFTPYIQKMVGTYYTDNRAEEYNAKLRDLKLKKSNDKNKPKASSRESQYQENLLEPIVDFDAIFIPDSSKVLGQAIAFFKTADVPSMTYLGTNLWNTDDTVRRAGTADTLQANRIFLVDAKNSDEEIGRSYFHRLYNKLNQVDPSLLESQAYEAARVLHDQIQNGYTYRSSLAERLRELGTVKGAYSDIYMNNSQELVRGISVLGVENGSIKKIY